MTEVSVDFQGGRPSSTEEEQNSAPAVEQESPDLSRLRHLAMWGLHRVAARNNALQVREMKASMKGVVLGDE